MKTLSTFQFDAFKPLLWLIATFLLVMAAGCKKDSPIESLPMKNIPVSADSLGVYSNKGDLKTVKLLLGVGSHFYGFLVKG